MSFFLGRKLYFKLFGASHSECIGMDLMGIPAGVYIDEEKLAAFMARRAPRRAAYSTSRREPDKVVFESGLRGGYTTGGMIRAVIYNKDQKKGDYEKLKYLPRPGHADLGARFRCGLDYDLSGGGEFSGRLTAPICIAGFICMAALEKVQFNSHIYSIGDVRDDDWDLSPCAFTKSEEKWQEMSKIIEDAAREGDSVGGIIEAAALNVPKGLGGPHYDGVESTLAQLMFTVPAVKGFEIGAGFEAARKRGSENNDEICLKDGEVTLKTNNCGGLLGGITIGTPLTVRVAFKPTPSISKPQKTVNLETMTEEELTVGGRHDACIVPRALPVVESIMAIALCDCEE